MRRGNKRKFGREKDQRKMLYKSLATALIDNGRIKTTSAKAKSLSTHFDKLVTIAKKQNLASRKLLAKHLGDKAIKKLMGEISLQFKDRKGGYTRRIGLGQRKSDGAPMSMIEFVQ